MKSPDTVFEYLTTLQGAINGIVGQLDNLMAKGDTAFLKDLQRLLERGKLKYPNTGTMWTAADRRWLNELQKEIEAIRRATIIEAENLVYIKTRDEILPEVEEAAKQELKELGEEIDAFHKKNPYNRHRIYGLTQQDRKNILDYEPYDGHSIGDWFKALNDADTTRIMQDVQKSRSAGEGLDKMMKRLLEYPNPTDPAGSLITSRNSARRIARTVLNGVSNNSRLGVFEANADIIDGVQFLATLDSRTSPMCAVLDGKIWTVEEMRQGLVKRPPLHPNCRSVLIPYIKLEKGDGSVDEPEEDEGRPAERENFEKLAEERQNAKVEETGNGKEWKDLSYNYRKRLVYKEMEAYEAKHPGKLAYKNVPPDKTFSEYLKTQPESFQREWLGKTRFEAYKAGNLELKDLVNPDTGFVRTIDKLGKIGDNREGSQANPTDKLLVKPKKYRKMDEGETKDRIDSAEDVEKYLRYVETESQRKETREIERLQSVILELEHTGRVGEKEYRETRNEFVRLRDKRAEQERRAIHEHIAPVSGKVTKTAEIKFENELRKRIKNNDIRAEGQQGLAFATRIIDTYNIETNRPLPTFVSNKRRAEYDSENNILDVGRTTGIQNFTVHEMGHYIEHNNSVIHEKCRNFYEEITKNGEVRSLAQDDPDGKYSADEMYKTASIPIPIYATKIYDDATEIMSVGIEMLLDDPKGFSKECPEFFNFIVNVIKGEK